MCRLMLNRLCERYGQPLRAMDGEVFHTFPSVAHLAEASEEGEAHGTGVCNSDMQICAGWGWVTVPSSSWLRRGSSSMFGLPRGGC